MLPSAMKLVAVARQSIDEVSWDSLPTELEQCFLIDVREPEEFAAGSIEGAINIPRGTLEFKIQVCPDLIHLGQDKLMQARFYLFCATCL